MSDVVDRVTVEDWKTCREVMRRRLYECSRDSIIEPIIINLRDSDTDIDSNSGSEEHE
jgi:hypothetical protein